MCCGIAATLNNDAPVNIYCHKHKTDNLQKYQSNHSLRYVSNKPWITGLLLFAARRNALPIWFHLEYKHSAPLLGKK